MPHLSMNDGTKKVSITNAETLLSNVDVTKFNKLVTELEQNPVTDNAPPHFFKSLRSGNTVSFSLTSGGVLIMDGTIDIPTKKVSISVKQSEMDYKDYRRLSIILTNNIKHIFNYVIGNL